MKDRFQLLLRRKEAMDKLAKIWYIYEARGDYLGMEEINAEFSKFYNTYEDMGLNRA
jgi:hypothetical protein